MQNCIKAVAINSFFKKLISEKKDQKLSSSFEVNNFTILEKICTISSLMSTVREDIGSDHLFQVQVSDLF